MKLLALQLVLVLTGSWDDTRGELRRFERAGESWRQVGEAVEVAVGERGLAWGRGLHPAMKGRQKKEGDRRSPAGVFAIGRVYDAAPLVCVDDANSFDYNRIVGAGKGEDMKLYRRAIVVGHNQQAKKGAGSCIFLHDGDSPTVGCTAMKPAALDVLAAWAKEGAVIVQLPKPVYQQLKEKWKLP